MAKNKKEGTKRPIETYEHTIKEYVNNSLVGLISETTDPYSGVKTICTYDPHLDPQFQWAGKTEHISFEVPTVSLHVHESIDLRTIDAVRVSNGEEEKQITLFDMQEQNRLLREAIEFYEHSRGWINRLVAGDNLPVM